LQSGYDIVAKSREDATKLLEAARVGAGRRVELPMVDFILVVEDAERVRVAIYISTWNSYYF
jgi:hypothetical protein